MSVAGSLNGIPPQESLLSNDYVKSDHNIAMIATETPKINISFVGSPDNDFVDSWPVYIESRISSYYPTASWTNIECHSVLLQETHSTANMSFQSKEWILTDTSGSDGLKTRIVSTPPLGSFDVLVKMKALSLNHRDVVLASVWLFFSTFHPKRNNFSWCTF